MQEEVSTAILATAKTFHWPFSIFLLELIGHGLGDEVAINVIFVVESKLGSGSNILGGEKRNFVEVRIGVVVRDSVDRAIGAARMVDKA